MASDAQRLMDIYYRNTVGTNGHMAPSFRWFSERNIISPTTDEAAEFTIQTWDAVTEMMKLMKDKKCDPPNNDNRQWSKFLVQLSRDRTEALYYVTFHDFVSL
jgi:hypothetical protein